MNNEKKSYEILQQELAAAADKITIGARYGHYKHPDKPYEVLGFVVWEENDEVAVMYQPIHEPEVVFARPVSVWLETVKWEGGTIPRFSRIPDGNDATLVS